MNSGTVALVIAGCALAGIGVVVAVKIATKPAPLPPVAANPLGSIGAPIGAALGSVFDAIDGSIHGVGKSVTDRVKGATEVGSTSLGISSTTVGGRKLW